MTPDTLEQVGGCGVLLLIISAICLIIGIQYSEYGLYTAIGMMVISESNY